MKNTPGTVALIAHACDRYALLYKGFEHFFSKHWNFNIPCNHYFATEETAAQVHGFTNIRSGKGEWSDRLTYLLSNEIKEDYILYFQEDMWLKGNVNEHFFAELFHLAETNRWQQVKLHSSEVYKTNPTGYNIEGFSVAKIDNAASDYLMSHQVTLWNKEFLLQQLVKGEHPWRNERRGTKRLRRLNADIYHADYFAENDKPPVNVNNYPVGRSAYNTVSVNGMLNVNVIPFIHQLKQDGLENYAAKLQHQYSNRITHDGKLQPRKEDFFQKIEEPVKKTNH